MNSKAFNYIKENLALNTQNKFIFKKEKDISNITIRGLGITDVQYQIENLINWFGIMAKSVDKLLETELNEKIKY